MPFTLSAPAEYREEIKKSRFIAHAAQVASVEEAQAFIARLSEPGASHNCWAWKLGNLYRFSDDGEPGGTAGRPILAAIEGQDCDQVAVLVIRYYGGIQLGTGGLARAYGGSAAKCLQGGERVELVARSRIRCHPGFAELPLLKARLADFEALVESERFDAEGAELIMALPEGRIAGFEQVLRDISRGRLEVKRL
ncbi:YigZ family protein [Metapseudomonas lalkuanensis]|uniref:YigZ family protein n=1 Tax=Metapseudomonas lalkuanensis TaxID=2604832 RepID=A0A5J6QRD8_9GAMM|nr:YigZ family protein [Pseudomonas lalkuanensis]QEY65060.1 YigZ family protein [Pseudomonas lalkuanensis]UCO97578.1 IMPACT family protein [Pseudomonas lalkuanensis]